MIPRPTPVDEGMATNADGARIAWYRYGSGPRQILFVPTWNIVDARVVGHQVVALAPVATVVTYDPRGAGRSDRPHAGYDFTYHAADALAVADANGFRDAAAVVTASRGLNVAALLAIQEPERVERIAAIAPYMRLEPEPAPPDATHLESWRIDWAGFMVPFMRSVFTEPDSDVVIEEMTAIGMDATPPVVITGELETDWTAPARALASIACRVLIIHGDHDAGIPVSDVEAITDAIPGARLELIAGGGHRPDIRTPELVNPLLLEFLLG